MEIRRALLAVMAVIERRYGLPNELHWFLSLPVTGIEQRYSIRRKDLS